MDFKRRWKEAVAPTVTKHSFLASWAMFGIGVSTNDTSCKLVWKVQEIRRNINKQMAALYSMISSMMILGKKEQARSSESTVRVRHRTAQCSLARQALFNIRKKTTTEISPDRPEIIISPHNGLINEVPGPLRSDSGP